MHSERLTVAQCRQVLAQSEGDELKAIIAEYSDDPRAGVQAAVESARRRAGRLQAESDRLANLLVLERGLRELGARAVAGVDEVGRGALAGPVTAGAVVLADRVPDGLDDSKRLDPASREDIAMRVRECAVACAVAHVDAARVDEVGIAKATREAMRAALASLTAAFDHVVVDGSPCGLHANETAMPRADGAVACVAAASVIAKVERDALMRGLALEHAEWGFDVNKGYGTPEHMDAIRRHGLSPIHRRSFSPGGGTAQLA